VLPMWCFVRSILFWFIPFYYIIWNTNEVLVKRNTLVFVIQCYMYVMPDEGSLNPNIRSDFGM
jgi:hypothetical protein